MAEGVTLLVYPAKDLATTKAFFITFLGVEPYVDSPYYVGFKTESLEIGLDPHGQEVIGYIEVKDIVSNLKALVDAGATTQQEPKDVGGGLLIAKVKDTNGTMLGLRQAAN